VVTDPWDYLKLSWHVTDTSIHVLVWNLQYRTKQFILAVIYQYNDKSLTKNFAKDNSA